MKMDQDHHAPLVDHALTILDEESNGRQGELIFANPEIHQIRYSSSSTASNQSY
jgi:hypothetical protein